MAREGTSVTNAFCSFHGLAHGGSTLATKTLPFLLGPVMLFDHSEIVVCFSAHSCFTYSCNDLNIRRAHLAHQEAGTKTRLDIPKTSCSRKQGEVKCPHRKVQVGELPSKTGRMGT